MNSVKVICRLVNESELQNNLRYPKILVQSLTKLKIKKIEGESRKKKTGGLSTIPYFMFHVLLF